MAGVKLHLSTSQIWSHFFENVDRLQDYEDCIAENKDNGMSLYITAFTICPQLVLYADERPVLYKTVSNQEECSNWAVYLITRYVAGVEIDKPVNDEKDDEKPKIIDLPMSKEREAKPVSVPHEEEEDDEVDDEQKILDVIYEREDEINQAIGDMLAVVLCEDDITAVKELYGAEFVSEVVDDFLQYLADNHNVSVYRPTLETDPETGEEILKEFPYGWDEDYEDVE